MKTSLKKAVKDESGKVLILALIVLVVGGLLLGPLLGLMSTGLMAGQMYERRTAEVYAADAGVEDAIWRITNNRAQFGPDGWYVYPESLGVNHKTVGVRVFREDLDPTCREELRYRIISTATGDSSTMIDAYLAVQFVDFSSLLNYAIVSQGAINLQPNSYVVGDVWLPNKDLLDGEERIDSRYRAYDSVHDEILVTWPSAEALFKYYLARVQGASDPGGSYNIDGQVKYLATSYRNGSFSIHNSPQNPSTGELILQGTVYVKGDLSFQQPGSSKAYAINLNDKTIFVDGDVYLASSSVSVSGSGCIIATGDIVFQPGTSSNPDDFVLVLSVGVGKTVTIQPNGNFTGCIAGHDVVTLQPGHPQDEFTLQHTSPVGKGLDFPMGVTDIDNLPPVAGLEILSWHIQQGGP